MYAGDREVMAVAFLANLCVSRGALTGGGRHACARVCDRAQLTLNPLRASWMCSAASAGSEQDGFTLKSEAVRYERYKTIYERVVTYPDGAEYSFDVEGSPRANFSSVLVFPFNSAAKTTVLIREYHPGLHALRYGFVAGFFDAKVHADEEAAARAELSEEAHLTGGTMQLLNSGAPVPRDKYSLDYFHMFLALDAHLDLRPRERDEEERIDIVRDVPVTEAIDMVFRGEFNLSSATLCLMAAERLRKDSLL
ncbi:hypothetical protein FVE85_2518 [Porphyridium purpureum]|uniref:Uncharacterized protein n=1 Tax=Porphyridium purpureum TaxID=35688 RepID=A0A5J4YLI7_PORPP|nr:hypothetical protein FVE85_2518 [Porphyridium purpureum]|eukprot:POR8877..scf291_13